MVNRPGADKIAVTRIARPGDIFIMLAAKTNHINSKLRRHLDELQKIASGHPPEMMHITLQRFGTRSQAAGRRLLDRLEEQKANLLPFNVMADGYLAVFSDFQKIHILKWTVPGNEILKTWYHMVDEVGLSVGLKPIYLRQGYGAWVTALLDIQPPNEAQLQDIPIPKPLFCVNRLMVSRLLGPGEYQLLGEFVF